MLDEFSGNNGGLDSSRNHKVVPSANYMNIVTVLKHNIRFKKFSIKHFIL